MARATLTILLLLTADDRRTTTLAQDDGLRDFTKVMCPELQCESSDGKDKMDAITTSTCYLMQRDDVNQVLYARECYDKSRAKKKEEITFCGFNAQSGEYAWVDENMHKWESQRAAVGDDVIKISSKQKSQFKEKMLTAECRQIIGVRKNLLPGRFCTDSYQCISSYCKEKVCKGRQKDDSCSKHEDCNNGLYCRMKDNWPYDTTCTRQKTTYERCSEDIECQNNQFCWYPSKAFREVKNKVCLEMYSQDVGETFGWEASNSVPNLDDFTQNGKYCVTGLAYPMSATEARCTRFKEMRFKGAVVPKPFKCNPVDPDEKCQLYFEIDEEDQKDTTIMSYLSTRNKIANDCKCSLGGQEQGGYCSSIIGSELYEKAVGAHQHMMSASQCHTMDRNNLRAQKDQKCGIGSYSNDFRFAVDKMFNVTYWPYIQKEETFKCIRRFFSDSYDSLILEQAKQLSVATLTAASLAFLSLY